jgi:hypothetical protein
MIKVKELISVSGMKLYNLLLGSVRRFNQVVLSRIHLLDHFRTGQQRELEYFRLLRVRSFEAYSGVALLTLYTYLVQPELRDN